MSNTVLDYQCIDHVAWTVPDLDAALAWYSKVLGAKLLYRLGPVDARELPSSPDGRDWTESHLGVPDARLSLAVLELGDGAKLELFQYERPTSPTDTVPPPHQRGGHHIGLRVPDIAAAATLLAAQGCEMKSVIAFDEGPTAGVKFQYFLDPWGNTFELVERPAAATPSQRTVRAVNPAALYDSVSFGFSHAVEQAPGRTLHLSGQVAWDGQGQLVGEGDVIAQTRQALANLRTVLAAAGATPSDVTRVRTYIVNHDPAKLAEICGLTNGFYDGHTPAANTVIGVQALALPGFLIEIEATAGLPA